MARKMLAIYPSIDVGHALFFSFFFFILTSIQTVNKDYYKATNRNTFSFIFFSESNKNELEKLLINCDLWCDFFKDVITF